MQGIVVGASQDGFPLSWNELPDPMLGPGEVLVDVYATAVNRADLLQRAGTYPPPPGASEILGLEMAGVIAEVADQAGEWQPGERVCALLAGGGYAQQVVVPHQLLFRLPDDWDFTRGAAVMEVFLTAFVNLFMEGELQKEEVALIHGGASGVGTAAIQLAHEADARVVITAGSEEKLERCRQLGADVAINYKEEDFAEAVRRDVGPIDVILDIGGADYLANNIELLNLRGRLIIIALLTGAVGSIDLGLLQRKRIRLIGSVLRSRTIEEKTMIVNEFRRRFWPQLVEGRINPVIDTVLPVTEADTAHEILKQNRNIGKVILSVR